MGWVVSRTSNESSHRVHCQLERSGFLLKTGDTGKEYLGLDCHRSPVS